MATKRTAKPQQPAAKRITKPPQSRMNAASAPESPSRLRLKLKTIDDVKVELARLYREGKAGQREVADVSKLGNVLNLLGRLIVDHELAAQIEAFEQRINTRRPK